MQELEEELSAELQESKESGSKYIYEEMFEDEQMYSKAVKYYYGMWDKLSQRTQTAWNEEIVGKVWGICQKLWAKINTIIPTEHFEMEARIGEKTETILLLFQDYLFTEQSYHPIMDEEI